MKRITVKVAGDINLDLLVFSGSKTSLEETLLTLGAPIYRIVEGTNENMVVSSTGTVLKRKKTRGGRRSYYEIAKNCYNNSGYLQVSVPWEKGVTTSTVHRLVAETFLGYQENKEVDHIDGNKLNNRVSNLRWISHENNCQNPLSRKGTGSCIWKDIRAVDKETSECFYFKDLKEVSKFLNLTSKGWKGAIIRCMRKEGGYAYGYYWWGTSKKKNL